MTKESSDLRKALVGSSGYVGNSLIAQTDFQLCYRSTNIAQIEHQSFDIVVCAGAPAQKWIANHDPESDRRNIANLISHLKTISCKMFILISTVDVFVHPVHVQENTPVDESGLHAYGLHRRLLERFVEDQFPNRLIVRLPGLVGPGLRKNVIFDLLNDNNLHAIDSRGIFQFYPMVNLWYDIQIALRSELKLVHLTAEPISVAEVSARGFGRPFCQYSAGNPVAYDLRTCHADIFGTLGDYQYSQRETIQAIRAYAQSEQRIHPPTGSRS